jgi:dynein heavy chain
MVTACKNYITDSGVNKIWDQQSPPLIEKLQNCVGLYNNYQNVFQMTKQKMEQSPGEIPFEFSAMFVFGKFELFCKRLDKVCYLGDNCIVFENFNWRFDDR